MCETPTLIDERPLFQRINRVLNHQNKRLSTAHCFYCSAGAGRCWHENPDLGRYYVGCF